MQHNNTFLGCKGTVAELRGYDLKKTNESLALLSLERTQVPSFANRVFGSYDCLVEFVLCHAALCFIREWRLYSRLPLLFFSLSAKDIVAYSDRMPAP